jgi:hypothetical protein
LFDRINIKAIILVMAFAAVLSIAVGGIGGVSMGPLLLRGLIFGLSFGIGAIIISMVVSRFLPELVVNTGVEQPEDDGETEERGKNVNIVMDDNNDAVEDDEGDQPGKTADGVDIDSSQIAPEIDSDSQGFQPASAQNLTEQGSSSHLPDIGAFAVEEEDDDDVDNESYGSADATEAPGAGMVKSRFSEMQTNDDDKKEFFQNNASAEDLAKGVRTMLKRDEKG